MDAGIEILGILSLLDTPEIYHCDLTLHTSYVTQPPMSLHYITFALTISLPHSCLFPFHFCPLPDEGHNITHSILLTCCHQALMSAL